MRIPESIRQTVHPYLAFRAILLSVARFNEAAGEKLIDSVLCPGLGTGVGQMEPGRCAIQMKMAWEQVQDPARIPSFKRIHEVHRAMLTI